MMSSGVKSFKCEQCGKCYAQRNTLQKHKKIHSQFMCNKCGKWFSYEDNLRRHRENNLCQSSYVRECTIAHVTEKHSGMHTGEKPFKCEQCGKCFIRKGYLLNHVKLHSKSQLKYQPSGKEFSCSSHLAIHAPSHAREKPSKFEKPFKCDQCEKCFYSKGALKCHMMSHTREWPFRCEQGGKSFPHKCTLKSHMVTHTGDKPSIGGQCDLILPTNIAIGEENVTLEQHMDMQTSDETCSNFTIKEENVTLELHTDIQTIDETSTNVTIKEEHVSHEQHTDIQTTDVTSTNVPIKEENISLALHTDVPTSDETTKSEKCDIFQPQDLIIKQEKEIYTGDKPFKSQSEHSDRYHTQNVSGKQKNEIFIGDKRFRCQTCGKVVSGLLNVIMHHRAHSKDTHEHKNIVKIVSS